MSFCLSSALFLLSSGSPHIESGVWFRGGEKPVLLAFPLDPASFHVWAVQVKNLECLFYWSMVVVVVGVDRQQYLLGLVIPNSPP